MASTNNPALDPEWDNPDGVAIDAFIFGGRRSTTVPLVTEARNWVEGVYMAATMGSETTAAAAGQQGVVRRDPFAMLPFMGYNMADHFQHWLNMGAKLRAAGAVLPEDLLRQLVPQGRRRQVRLARLRREHARAVVDAGPYRGHGGRAGKRLRHQPALRRPATGTGLSFSREQFASVIGIDHGAWQQELKLHDELFAQLAYHLPAELTATKARIADQLAA